jgi:hypothetical protein
MEQKNVKIVYDGQGYWLLWHWENRWSPDKHPTPEQLPQLSGFYLYVTGPFWEPGGSRECYHRKSRH